jgi:hypothetical protein
MTIVSGHAEAAPVRSPSRWTRNPANTSAATRANAVAAVQAAATTATQPPASPNAAVVVASSSSCVRMPAHHPLPAPGPVPGALHGHRTAAPAGRLRALTTPVRPRPGC